MWLISSSEQSLRPCLFALICAFARGEAGYACQTARDGIHRKRGVRVRLPSRNGDWKSARRTAIWKSRVLFLSLPLPPDPCALTTPASLPAAAWLFPPRLPPSSPPARSGASSPPRYRLPRPLHPDRQPVQGSLRTGCCTTHAGRPSTYQLCHAHAGVLSEPVNQAPPRAAYTRGAPLVS